MGSSTVVEVGERAIAVFNTKDGLFAVDNWCRHRGGPISEGWISHGVVTCPWHWWRYELATGQRLGSERISLDTYPVAVRDGIVVVDGPHDAPPVRSMRERLLEHAREWERER